VCTVLTPVMAKETSAFVEPRCKVQRQDEVGEEEMTKRLWPMAGVTLVYEYIDHVKNIKLASCYLLPFLPSLIFRFFATSLCLLMSPLLIFFILF
jgi:hypothetical protein